MNRLRLLIALILLCLSACVDENESSPKVVFITAIFGVFYEKRLHRTLPQSIPSDWICFTDNEKLQPNGWEIDRNPYHTTHPSKLDDGTFWNSYSKNTHPFNIAKYYKESFQNIPRLKKYDVVIWIDGNTQIQYDGVAEYALKKIRIQGEKVLVFHHEYRQGNLESEAIGSDLYTNKYRSTSWFGYKQPQQHVHQQYLTYVKLGYDQGYWLKIKEKIGSTDPHFGVWMTGFVAFDNKDGDVSLLLDLWFLHNLKYTTQDQVSFPFIAQRTNIIPYTLPDNEVWGDEPHKHTKFFVKWEHGQRRLQENTTRS